MVPGCGCALSRWQCSALQSPDSYFRTLLSSGVIGEFEAALNKCNVVRILIRRRDRFNYDAATLGKLSSIFGLVYMIGAIVAKKRMTQVGARRHVTESNVANMLAWLAWSKYITRFCVHAAPISD